MTVYASRMSGEHADRSEQLQRAIGLLEQHQSVNRHCRTCGTSSPCRLPAVIEARDIVAVAARRPPQPILTTVPELRRAAMMTTDSVAVCVGQVHEERGSWGDAEGSHRQSGAPLRTRRKTFPKRAGHYGQWFGDANRRIRVREIVLAYGRHDRAV